MKRLLIAVNFLTILPFPPARGVKEEDMGRAMVFFPLTGLLIGIITAGVALIAGLLPRPVAAALILIAMIMIPGGIHLDGFADSCDGLYGRFPKERRLKIMRDSRIGVMGALGLIGLLILKYSIILSVPKGHLWRWLLIMPLAGRWAQAMACGACEYARDDGKARAFIKYAGGKEVFIATFFSIVTVFFIMGSAGLIVFFAAILFTCGVIEWIKRKIDGMTGDTVGAVSELVEIFTGLCALSIIWLI